MLEEISKEHLTRLRMATVNRLGRKDLARWITENTSLGGKPYSFENHQWQLRVLQEESPEITLIKSAQLGASELALRMVAAMVMTASGNFSVGYLFPTASFSMTYAKTRFGPICDESPALRAALAGGNMDNAEVRSFGSGKNILFRGTNSETSGLSHSLDLVAFDEYSFMDQDKAKIYESRLIASKHRIKIKLSTPTFPHDPISTAFENSKRWFNFCKCDKCGHFFYPDYYEHVKVPGWDAHLDDIVEENLHRTNYLKAALHCPSCGGVPSLLPEHREWVCQNASENYVATGFKVQPFDVPSVVTIPYLVQVSTQYNRKADFRNFNLGMTAEDAESGVTEGDMEAIGVEMVSSPFQSHVMGIDLGLVCHFTVGGTGPDGKFGIVHYEKVPLPRFRERYFALKSTYRVSVVCSDQQPFVDLIMGMSEEDPLLYGCMYTSKSGMDIFEVKTREQNTETALGALRQVSINRSALFDRMLVEVREGRMWVRKTSEWEVFKAHAVDMRRTQSALRNGEFTSSWTKSTKGADHLWHSAGYCWIASRMRGIAHNGNTPPPMLRTFKLKQR